jgi:hypothetical protein
MQVERKLYSLTVYIKAVYASETSFDIYKFTQHCTLDESSSYSMQQLLLQEHDQYIILQATPPRQIL